MILISSVVLGDFPLPKGRWLSHRFTLESDEIAHVQNERECYFAKCKCLYILIQVFLIISVGKLLMLCINSD